MAKRIAMTEEERAEPGYAALVTGATPTRLYGGRESAPASPAHACVRLGAGISIGQVHRAFL
jgi:hypothetical protein